MGDYGCVWNFERLPESTGLQVEGFLGPNPIPKTIRRTLVGRNRTQGVRCWRIGGLAMPRTNQNKAERQRAKGAWSHPPHSDATSHLAAEQPKRGTEAI